MATTPGAIQEPGAFGSALRYVGRPGQAVLQALSGNLGAAGRQLGDFALETVDAFLPGDLIPALTTPDDFTSGSELLGMEDAPWWQRLPVDIGIGVATDPLSYLTFGASAAARGAQTARQTLRSAEQANALAQATGRAAPHTDEALRALRAASDAENVVGMQLPFTPSSRVDLPVTRGSVRQAAEAAGEGLSQMASFLPQGVRTAGATAGRALAEGGRQAGGFIRRVTGNLAPGEAVREAVQRGESVSNAVRNTATQEIRRIMEGADKPMREAIGSAIHGMMYEGDTLVPLAGTMADRIPVVANKFGVNAEELARRVGDTRSLMDKFWDDISSLGVAREGAEGVADYLPRQWTGYKGGGAVSAADEMLTGSPFMGRKLETWEDIQDFVAANPEARLEMDALPLLQRRASGQAGVLGRQEFVNALFGEGAPSVTSKEFRNSIQGTMRTLREAGEDDVADVLSTMLQPSPPPGWASKALRLSNQWFKPAAVYGIGIPRIAAITRNQIGGVWQSLSEGGISARQALQRAPDNIYRSIEDGLATVFKNVKRGGKLGPDLRVLDEAADAGRGSLQGMREYIREQGSDTLLEAFDRGVVDGFVQTEGMLDAWVSASPKGQKVMDVMRMPGAMFQGLESRMRLGAFYDLINGGMDPSQASRIVRDTFLDYSMARGTGAYRTARDIIPFLSFTAQSIPQQARFLAREPAAAVALASAMQPGAGQEPVMPWIAEQPHLRIGEDEEGNAQYIAGLGLPVEALNFLPQLSGNLRDIGRDVERSVVGSSQPLLKTAYSAVSGRDPYFGSKYMSYDRTPAALVAMGLPERGEFGRAYQGMAGTGALQPLETALNVLNPFFDERYSAMDALVKGTTGLRIASSDPDLAASQVLQEALAMDPAAREYRTYYGGSEEVGQLIEALNEARSRLREKRDAKEQAQAVQ